MKNNCEWLDGKIADTITEYINDGKVFKESGDKRRYLTDLERDIKVHLNEFSGMLDDLKKYYINLIPKEKKL